MFNARFGGNQMERIEIYRNIAALLLSRTYRLDEMPHVSPIFNYLKQEIENHERTETSDDTGTQS
jgi:hypothetical protein